MGLGKVLAKAFGSSLAKKTTRGEAKEALKARYKRQGMSDTEATNKANLEVRKAEGKETALRKTETKQDRDSGKFKSAGEKGGTKTLSLEATDTKSGRRVSMKRPSDKSSTVRATAERQKLRSAGEKMYTAGLKDAANTRVKKTAKAAGVGAGIGGASSMGDSENKKTASSGGTKDQRVNPKDYPTYQKKTKSAATFREEFKKAKDNDKKTFSFEGRTYKVADGPKQKMMGGGYAMKGKK